MLKIKIALLVAIVMMMVMALPMSASFASSPVAGLYPQIVPIQDDYMAILVDENENFIAGITGPELIITHYENRNDAPYAHIREALEKAFAEVQDVESLNELCDKLDGIIKEFAPDLSADTVVVGDLFDVTLVGENGERLKSDDVYIKVRFKLDYDANYLIGVLHNVGGEYWETIRNDRVKRNYDNNTVEIMFSSLSPILFLDDSGELTVPDGPDSPQTGAAEDHFFTAAIVCTAGALVCTATAITVAKKKQQESK